MWFILALISAVLFASQELLMRVTAVRTGSPRVFSLVFNLWGASLAALFFFINGGSFRILFSLSPHQYGLLFLAVVVYGMYERTHFFARQGVEASVFAIIFRLSTVIGFIGAISLLHELLTGQKILGVCMVITASFLLIFRNPKFRISTPFWYAIASAVLLGFASVVDKPASAALPASLYSILVWCLPLPIIAFPGISKNELIKEFRIGGWKIALAALVNVSGYIIYITALSMAEASRVNPIEATSGILTVLGGIVFLREKDHMTRKLFAGLIAFIGVILLR